MTSSAQLLLAAVSLPLLGAGLLWFFADRGKEVVRISALVTSLFTCALACLLASRYQPADGQTAFAELSYPWLGDAFGLDVRFSLALDGLSLWLFVLSTLLVVTSVLVSWEAIDERPALFYSLLLTLETGMLGVFAARDLILFYVFFEFTLIPLFFLIGIWGSEERRYAAMKFFLYTLAGSVLTFLGLLAIVLHYAPHNGGVVTFSIPELTAGLAAYPIDDRSTWCLLSPQQWIFLALLAGFAIKVPLFPLHTWLPLAHVQAPTAGSVILAGVLLKLGTYGFVRFSLPLLPDASASLAPLLLWLAVAGVVYGALVALAQVDLKRLIAYSSVSHLGYCMLGLFALNAAAVEGSVLQMVNHGLSTGGLFAVVGLLYERYHTRQIRELGGVARRLPRLAFFMVLFTLSSIGLPGLNGFAGEFLILLGAFQRSQAVADPWQWQFLAIAVLAVFGVVLGAWYMLWLVQRVFFGPLVEPEHRPDDPPLCDLSAREVLALAPLAVAIVWIGVLPGFFLDRTRPTLEPLTQAAALRFNQGPIGAAAPAVAGRTPEEASRVAR